MRLLNLTLSFLFLLLLGSSCGYSQDPSSPPLNKETMNHSNNPYYSRTDQNKVEIPLSEWKKVLDPEVYHIAFEKGTERSHTGKYWDFEGKGTYYCAVCGNRLFRSDAKFASSCGWPSFFEPLQKAAVLYQPDHSFGMNRTEVLCARCHAHLGHVFEDGPKPTGLRYCMNSPVLDFVPDAQSVVTP